MAKSEIVGSWYSSGYHGHFRSKSRNDFICEYRYLAKPTPPKHFVNRAQEHPSKHLFSKHDNRQSFLNDALYFEEGLGRRRIKNSTNRWQSDFLAWMPQKPELDRAGAPNTSYKVDFRGIPSQPIRQKLVKRPKTSFDDDLGSTTSYRYAHCKDNPNRATLSAMNNEALKAKFNVRKQRPADCRESVAACLTWYRPSSARAKRVNTIPAETQTIPMATTCNHHQATKTASSTAESLPTLPAAQPPPPVKTESNIVVTDIE